MLILRCLIVASTYACSDLKCSYSLNDKEVFKKYIAFHADLIRNKLLNNYSYGLTYSYSLHEFT